MIGKNTIRHHGEYNINYILCWIWMYQINEILYNARVWIAPKIRIPIIEWVNDSKNRYEYQYGNTAVPNFITLYDLDTQRMPHNFDAHLFFIIFFINIHHHGHWIHYLNKFITLIEIYYFVFNWVQQSAAFFQLTISTAEKFYYRNHQREFRHLFCFEFSWNACTRFFLCNRFDMVFVARRTSTLCSLRTTVKVNRLQLTNFIFIVSFPLVARVNNKQTSSLPFRFQALFTFFSIPTMRGKWL